MNRITAAFARMEAQIADRIANGLTTKAKVKATAKAMDMTIEEYVRFQTLKSLAVANEKLTADEGQTVYAALGESVSTFNGQPVHVKCVLTGLFQELLKAEVARRTA